MQPIWPQLSRRLFENVYCVQFRVLMRKNYLLAIRNRKGTLGQLFTPVGIIFLLLFFQYISEIVLDQDILHPQSYKVAIIPKCRSRDGIPCHTILYSPLDLQYEWGSSRDVLRLVAEYNDLDFQTDFFGLDYKNGTSCQDQHGITDWGIGQTTLEDVFIRVVERFPASDMARFA
eukprot:TRINITY_DN1758_c0_g1_i11.p1 TRINITY_DN1758_c0_g1~~TRINITY_DN1758_c0_g1_i11.p1  ORF type:complete len:174 (-),score=26.63 TRINITY_DN1758_c0_g1_i11:91-612(-)